MVFHPPSLASETIAHIGSFPIRNSMVMAWLAMLVLIVVGLVFKAKYKKDVAPKGFVNLVEMFIGGLYDFFHEIVQDHPRTKRFFPIVATIFLFVITSNWMGILPGVGSIGLYVPKHEEAAQVEQVTPAQEVAEIVSPVKRDFAAEENTETTTEAALEKTVVAVSPEVEVISEKVEAEVIEEKTDNVAVSEESSSHEEGVKRDAEGNELELIHIFRTGYADVNMTLALALISVLTTMFFGMRILGFGGYWGKFFVNPLKDPIGTFVGLLELISEVAKLISFSFRLFGNIFAGEVLLVVISFLAPFIAPLPFYGLEIFVGFVQALVFSLLTTVFMKLASDSHH